MRGTKRGTLYVLPFRSILLWICNCQKLFSYIKQNISQLWNNFLVSHSCVSRIQKNRRSFFLKKKTQNLPRFYKKQFNSQIQEAQHIPCRNISTMQDSTDNRSAKGFGEMELIKFPHCHDTQVAWKTLSFLLVSRPGRPQHTNRLCQSVGPGTDPGCSVTLTAFYCF